MQKPGSEDPLDEYMRNLQDQVVPQEQLVTYDEAHTASSSSNPPSKILSPTKKGAKSASTSTLVRSQSGDGMNLLNARSGAFGSFHSEPEGENSGYGWSDSEAEEDCPGFETSDHVYGGLTPGREYETEEEREVRL
jgi:hypothetical protein